MERAAKQTTNRNHCHRLAQTQICALLFKVSHKTGEKGEKLGKVSVHIYGVDDTVLNVKEEAGQCTALHSCGGNSGEYCGGNSGEYATGGHFTV